MYKVLVDTFDDLDGEKIESGGETIDFSVAGVEYSIDLRDEHAAELRRQLGNYIGTRAASAATNAGAA
jgi:hypothetical protein